MKIATTITLKKVFSFKILTSILSLNIPQTIDFGLMKINMGIITPRKTREKQIWSKLMSKNLIILFNR
ncbi:hypothetical protein AB4544_22915, partial [Vibrio sp. 10N.222.45.F7]|uniref:hypothetical protein n=1 Tax=Vibrio sp. 10N.222.45.F7 TaxID=3229598 RepID=UPI003553CBFC